MDNFSKNFWENNTIQLIKLLIEGKELETSIGTLIMSDDSSIGFKMQNEKGNEIICVGDLSFKQIKDLLKKERKILI